MRRVGAEIEHDFFAIALLPLEPGLLMGELDRFHGVEPRFLAMGFGILIDRTQIVRPALAQRLGFGAFGQHEPRHFEPALLFGIDADLAGLFPFAARMLLLPLFAQRHELAPEGLTGTSVPATMGVFPDMGDHALEPKRV